MEGMSNTLPEVVRAYMSEIGSKRTEAKSRASRLNAAKGAQARRKDAAQVACLCHGGDSLEPMAHKTTCPRGRLLRQRARTAAVKENP